ncbi:MAG: polysaccharide deacetylase family protein [Labilithrix sp.]|nr:polysaccharide deacetylase family protein [Labilithrix sp.]MCW5817729.1 polysaccharide deacetylase family protein [Labilithrix sp.]
MPLARALLLAATLGGILFSVWSVLHGAPELWVAIGAGGLYVGLVLAGVFVVRLRMFADAIVQGPKDANGIVLTFDDGPDPKHTPRVLDVLDEHGAKAVFFVIGRKVKQHPEVVREIVRRGHEVGVHGFTHDRLFALRGTKRVKDDLARAVATIEEVTKKRPTLFRPPIGHTSPAIVRAADQLDLTIVGWSVAGYDGIARAKAAKVAARITARLEDGAIVLLHDAAERDDHEPAGVAALRAVLAGAEDKNLRVVPLTDWLED